MDQAGPVQQRQSGLMFGTSRRAFTLIELLVAIALIGLLATIVIPNLYRRVPQYERQQFIGNLNGLMRFTWQQAVVTHKLHRVQFDLEKREVRIAVERNELDSKGERAFESLKDAYMTTSLIWPEHISIKNFYIEGSDELARFSVRKAAEVWFYIVPEGLAQDVIINGVDSHDTVDGKPRPFGLVLNPFSAQFKVYDTFQK